MSNSVPNKNDDQLDLLMEEYNKRGRLQKYMNFMIDYVRLKLDKRKTLTLGISIIAFLILFCIIVDDKIRGMNLK